MIVGPINICGTLDIIIINMVIFAQMEKLNRLSSAV